MPCQNGTTDCVAADGAMDVAVATATMGSVAAGSLLPW